MPRRITFATVAALLILPFGCQTGSGEKNGISKPSTASPVEERTGLSGDELVDTAERLRDREYEEHPEFVPVDEIERESDSDPASRGQTAAPVARALFGVETLAPPAGPPFREVARYDPDRHRIVFSRDYPSEKTLELALLTCAVQGLEARHFPELSSDGGTDQSVAAFAARHAAPMLVAAAYLLRQRIDTETEPIDRIAARPELALRLEPLTKLLERRRPDSGEPVTSRDELSSRLRAFGFREGLALAAALHRAGGWSGVELLYEFNVESTADVVRPDRWMKGRGLGSWKWPDDPLPKDTETGRVGPALTAIWLGQQFRPELARTVYSGWRSDIYRVSTQNSSTRVDWLQQWDTPTSARQIAKAARRLLEEHHEKGSKGDVRWKVVRKGLKVGVSIAFRDDAPLETTPDAKLLGITARFRPRKPLPVTFEPARTEEYRKRARRADIEEGTWKDPAGQLAVDIAPARRWTFRLSRTLPLRWFSKRSDGTVLQLSTELEDPLAPEFGSESYRDILEDRFKKPLESAEWTEPERLDRPVDDALHFTVDGTKQDKPWKIGVWQFQYGDVVTTVSLQAPRGAFDKHVDLAQSVYDSIRTLDPPPGSGEQTSESGGGEIEYEIEEPNR